MIQDMLRAAFPYILATAADEVGPNASVILQALRQDGDEPETASDIGIFDRRRRWTSCSSSMLSRLGDAWREWTIGPGRDLVADSVSLPLILSARPIPSEPFPPAALSLHAHAAPALQALKTSEELRPLWDGRDILRINLHVEKNPDSPPSSWISAVPRFGRPQQDLAEALLSAPVEDWGSSVAAGLPSLEGIWSLTLARPSAHEAAASASLRRP